MLRALWLAEKRACIRVCEHGCDVKMVWFSRADHASTNFKKFLAENSTSLFHLPIPSLAETWKIVSLQTCCVNVFAWDDILSEKSIFFANQKLIWLVQDFATGKRILDSYA